METQGMTSRALLLGVALLVVPIAPAAAQVGATRAVDVLDQLQTKVDTLKMPAQAKQSLEVHLDVADAVLSDGDTMAAMKELGLFANEAGRQGGKVLSDKEASGLVHDARGLITLLRQHH